MQFHMEEVPLSFEHPILLWAADMGTTHLLFDSTRPYKVLIRLNSWFTMALQELIQISSRLKMDFWVKIQIESRLKNLSEYFDSNQLATQKGFQNFDLNRLMTQKLSRILNLIKSWLNDSNPLLISLAFFGLSLNFVGLFWASLNFADLLLAFH